MNRNKRRFCSVESREDPTSDHAVNTAPNILASALEQHGIPYELVIHRLEKSEDVSDRNSCDQYPDGAAAQGAYVCEFLTTDPHFENACTVASQILPGNTGDQ